MTNDVQADHGPVQVSAAFDPIDLGGRRLANRIVMAPMTRSRAAAGGVPTEAMATYYAQRASAGLIVTEGTQPSAIGQGYPATPGLHDDEQVRGWRRVTAAVHDEGGVIFVQLMHTGRIGHPSLLADGAWPVGPSPVAAAGRVFTGSAMEDFVTPMELDEAGIEATVVQYASAASRAMDAGFDGVEVHAANGYLLHQFLSTNANRRGDRWGGSIEGRVRLTSHVAGAVADAIGGDRVGLRISPGNTYNDIFEPDHRQLYPTLVRGLGPLDLAYLHIAETDPALTRRLRRQWRGVLILNPATGPGPTGPEQLALIDDGTADMISFATLFLANPDLPRRLAAGGPYNPPERASYYGGDDQGFTDYPTLGPA